MKDGVDSMIEEEEPGNVYDPVLGIAASVEPPTVKVFYTAVSDVSGSSTWESAEKDRKLIAEFWQTWVTIYPIHVDRSNSDYLSPKYSTITSITLDWNDFGLPSTPEDVRNFFNGSLPRGFSIHPESGLGLERKYRLLIHMVSQLAEIRYIIFSKTEDSRVDGDSFYFNLQGYHALRKRFNRITENHQKEAIEEKQILAYSNILHRHDPDKFPRKTTTRSGDALHHILSDSLRNIPFGRKDQKAAVAIVSRAKEELAKHDPTALLKLRAEIEHVTLGRLIERYEEMLCQHLTESHWQKFFKENSSVLSLAFAYPVLLVKDQAYVGTANVDGVGAKIADYLFASKFTGNLAVFEC